MINEMEGQVGWFDLDTWCGKTLSAHSRPTKAETSKPSSRKSQGSQSRIAPMCLCLTGGGGANPAVSTASWERSALLGEYTTHSFGEYPNEENVSRLSQILEDCPHPKYSLSGTACAGIIRRADNRGKELPPQLKEALEAQIERSKAQKPSARPRTL